MTQNSHSFTQYKSRQNDVIVIAVHYYHNIFGFNELRYECVSRFNAMETTNH